MLFHKHIILLILLLCIKYKCCAQDKNLFPYKYKSFGVNITSIIPKTKNFQYNFEIKDGSNPYRYLYYYNTNIEQYLCFGLGINYSYYKVIKHLPFSAWYYSISNNLNLYSQKFKKTGEEYISVLRGFYSTINEKSYNVQYEPSFNLSQQTKINSKLILNVEAGIGFNCHIFTAINKTSYDKATNYSYNEKAYYPNLFLYTKFPLKLELIFKLKKRWLAIALTGQICDSYSILYRRLHQQIDYNSIGNKHDLGFNSPTFLYPDYSSNNYPNKSLNINVSLSIKL